jgi:hypothetical protein
MSNQVMKKPTSKLGVTIVKIIRFPDMQNAIPGVGTYDHQTFIDFLSAHCSSKRGTLSNLSKVRLLIYIKMRP